MKFYLAIDFGGLKDPNPCLEQVQRFYSYCHYLLKQMWVGLSKDLSCEAGSLSYSCPNPHRHLQSGLRLYFPAGALGCVVCFTPHRLSGLFVHECGAAGSASGQTACSIRPTLGQSQSRHGNASPLRPSCPSLPLLLVWMNVYFLFPWCRTSLSFDFLSVLVVRGGTVCLPMPPSWFYH